LDHESKRAASQPDERVSRATRQVPDVLTELSRKVPLWTESESDWQRVGSGLSYQVLARDVERERVGMLVRLSPGASYPPHTHAGREELYLLEGELRIDSKKIIPGDYHRAEPGSSDQFVWSGTGCMCVLLTSTEDILR
jgi:anti-sigma factor ChrR (cupin superfamily)